VAGVAAVTGGKPPALPVPSGLRPKQPNIKKHARRAVRVITIIDLLSITIIDGSRGLHMAEVAVASSLCSGSSFRFP
jgi:hypothetical protein